MCISVDPGTYSITAGEWGGVHTQTHIFKLSGGQSANIDFFLGFLFNPFVLADFFISLNAFETVLVLVFIMSLRICYISYKICLTYNLFYSFKGI